MSCRDAGGPSAALHSVVNPAGPSTTRWRLSADHYLSPQKRGSSRRFTRSPRRRGHRVGRRLCLPRRHKSDLPRRLLFVHFLAKATSLSDRLAVAIMSTRPSTALRGRSFRSRCVVAVSGRGYRSRRLEGRSRKVKVALVLNQLRDGDVLDGDGVVGVGRDHAWLPGAPGICPAELAAPNSGDSFALSPKSLSDGYAQRCRCSASSSHWCASSS